MGKFFGTDGIRGIAYRELTEKLVTRVSKATAVEFSKENSTLFIGRDTRLSGPDIENAVCRGFKSEDWDVVSVGVIPTPGIAYVCKTKKSMGVVISASHNPAEYNGIKFFNSTGEKLTDEQENSIEARLDKLDFDSNNSTCKYEKTLQDDYLNHLLKTTSLNLTGKKIAIDCAFGATYKIAPKLFKALGAEIIEIAARNNGDRINDKCGATYPETVAKLVSENKDVVAGFSFDGDGDRCIAVDENGDIVDGDKTMGIIATSLQKQNRLPNDLIITTVMSNGGLSDYLKSLGISMNRTQVGDRYVWKEMKETGSNLGGEQSGHVIVADRGTTGDGLVTAISLLEAIENLGSNISSLSSKIQTYPQLLVNVMVKDKQAVLDSGIIPELNDWGSKQFSGSGRVLIRPSGTEPKIRVMAESPSKDDCERVVKETASRIKKDFGI